MTVPRLEALEEIADLFAWAVQRAKADREAAEQPSPPQNAPADSPANPAPTTAPLIRDAGDLVEAIRQAKLERELSDRVLEGIAGMADGSVTKYLAHRPSKALGFLSTFHMLGALGKALVIVDDPKAIAAVRRRWVKRHRRGGAAMQILSRAKVGALFPEGGQEKLASTTESANAEDIPATQTASELPPDACA